jgi:hypothetical protein
MVYATAACHCALRKSVDVITDTDVSLRYLHFQEELTATETEADSGIHGVVAENSNKVDDTMTVALVADENISIDDTPEIRAVLQALASGNGQISSVTVVVSDTMTVNGSVYTGSIKATITSDGQVTNYCRHGYGVLKTHSGNYHKGQWRDMVTQPPVMTTLPLYTDTLVPAYHTVAHVNVNMCARALNNAVSHC